MVLEDIVHGDVKCENVLIFEKEQDPAGGSNQGIPSLSLTVIVGH